MPYTLNDPPKYIQSKPKEFIKRWIAVFNTAHEKAIKDGKDEKEAEKIAFKMANGVVVEKDDKIKESYNENVIELESSSIFDFSEATFIEAAKSGKEWDVVLIAEGESKNFGSHGLPRYYSEKALKAAVEQGLFSKAPVRIYEQSNGVNDHLPENLIQVQNGLIKNQVGFIENERYGEFTDKDGKTRKGVLAKFHVLEGFDWLRAAMTDMWNKGKSMLGFSIDGGGNESPKLIDGKAVDLVDEISVIAENTLVTDPAAGGGILRLAASINEQEKKKLETAKMREKLIAMIKAQFPKLMESITDETNDSDILDMFENALKESKKEPEKVVEVKEEKPVEKKEEKDESEDLKESIRKLRDEMEVSNKSVLLNTRLSESTLPEKAKKALRESFEGKNFDVKDLDKQLATMQDVYAELKESAPSVGPQIKVGAEPKDKMAVAMDGYFSGENEKDKDGNPVQRFVSIKEAYAQVTGRPDAVFANPATVIADSYAYAPGLVGGENRMVESYDTFRRNQLRESMKSSDWAEILGDSITRKMIKDFQGDQLDDVYKLVSNIETLNDFRTQRRQRLGGFGVLSTVSEQGTYKDLSDLTDEEATYAPAKKGGLANFTMEMFANDDNGAIRAIPTKLGRAARQTLYRDIFDMFKDNLEQDGSTTLSANARGNYITTALSTAAWAEMTYTMRTLAKYGDTYDLLGAANKPKILLVPNELEEMAGMVAKSDVAVNAVRDASTAGNNYQHATEPNLFKGMVDPIVVDYWTDTDNWWAIADPRKAPTIELGFYKGKREPELFVQDQPNVGSMFTSDKITYKVRFIYGYAILDYRSFGGAVVS